MPETMYQWACIKTENRKLNFWTFHAYNFIHK
jgi:hypothetical protein